MLGRRRFRHRLLPAREGEEALATARRLSNNSDRKYDGVTFFTSAGKALSEPLILERSLIENRLNREAKQHPGLGSSLTRTAAGMRTATYFSMMALLFYRVLEIRRTQVEDALEDPRYEKLGVGLAQDCGVRCDVACFP